MRQFVLDNRRPVSAGMAALIGALLIRLGHGFNTADPIYGMVYGDSPALGKWLYWSYTAMLFTTPLWISIFGLTWIYTYWWQPRARKAHAKLPPFPDFSKQREVRLVIGEQHKARVMEPAENPQWLTIPEQGLFAGLAIFGAIGSGKTNGALYPYAQQILSFAADDPKRKCAAITLEVKGDFCHEVKKILAECGRSADYVELNLESEDKAPFRYNPLYNDLDAYAQAYGIASVISGLFGQSKEPFWEMAAVDLLTFTINLLRTTRNGYCTLHDVYRHASFMNEFRQTLEAGKAMYLGQEYVVLPKQTVAATAALGGFDWKIVSEDAEMFIAPLTPALQNVINENDIRIGQVCSLASASEEAGRDRETFKAIADWFTNHFNRMDSRLQTSIIEGIVIVLARFTDNPEAKYVLCPPRETYDLEGANAVDPATGKRPFGSPFPPFADCIETGKVIALNMPLFANPGMTGLVVTLAKMDFQRAMLGRIPQMAAEPGRYFRPAMFLCDEYQFFSTCGGRKAMGDEKFFALSRQTRCIPIIANQSVCSLRAATPGDEIWRVLLQCFRTVLFLGLRDHSDMTLAADMFGKEFQINESFTVSEAGQNSNVSPVSGRMMGKQSQLTITKSYASQMEHRFTPTLFGELPNYAAVLTGYDGTRPIPPTFVYLKPWYLPKNLTYFEQLEQGLFERSKS